MDLMKETIRYLGYGKNRPDDTVLGLIEEALAEVEAATDFRSVLRRFPMTLRGTSVTAGGLTLTSANLTKNLAGCEEVLFYAATLGVGVDRLLNRNLKLHIAKAAVIQAAAAAYIEECIDRELSELSESLAKEGMYLRPRFSPGYGDLSLTVQGEFLQVLEAAKRIGLTLSEGGIMLPEKSVTAIIGISCRDDQCPVQGCESCGKTNCAFRRCPG